MQWYPTYPRNIDRDRDRDIGVGEPVDVGGVSAHTVGLPYIPQLGCAVWCAVGAKGHA